METSNETGNLSQELLEILEFWGEPRVSLYISIPMTTIYVSIFITGLVGNVITCMVIARHRHMQTATNLYLFSLAVSDLLLLFCGLPEELHKTWYSHPYVFGEAFCRARAFAAEATTCASILTITAFTVERYVAICHPLKSHTMSKLSRVAKMIIGIWLLAVVCAVPQVIPVGLVYAKLKNGTYVEGLSACSILPEWTVYSRYSFQVSTLFFFVLPMGIISALYILIAAALRRSTCNTSSVTSEGSDSDYVHKSRRTVIKMLVAVVIAFFVCWAPFHAQRLLAIHGDQMRPLDIKVYQVLTNTSGILYYMSATINPILYHILSAKFRKAFRVFSPFFFFATLLPLKRNEAALCVHDSVKL
ncbi:unnamed protein product, partial [Darwinula stevensoni]